MNDYLIVSAGIGLLILWSSWRLLRESVDVVREATPAGIDPVDVRSTMVAATGSRMCTTCMSGPSPPG